MDYIKDKVIIVTGAGSGICQATAELLGKQGGKIIVGDLNYENACKTAEAIIEKGGMAKPFAMDVSKSEDAFALVDYAVKEFGDLDVLVNGAGIMPRGQFDIQKLEKWLAAVDVNFKGVISCTYAAVKKMLEPDDGKIRQIVSISSTSATNWKPAQGIYCATKHSVKWLMDSLRREYPGKIKFSTVYPSGVLDTNINTSFGIQAGDPLKGMKDPFGRQNDFDYDKNMDCLFKANLADVISYVIAQPQGIVITDLMVRASGELPIS